MAKSVNYQLTPAADAARANRTATVFVNTARVSADEVREEIGELNALATAAQLDVLATQVVKIRQRPHPAHYVGAGAVQKLAQLIEDIGARRLVFSVELTVTQVRNLEEALRVKVLDRTDVILMIFSRRASTHEGKLQVALANCRREFARLAGLWTHLERQRGGIGLRGGPGEKQIELDRRLLARKIRRLEEQIDKMGQRKALARRRRRKNGIMTAALVGYTNAGKSSLFNLLAQETVVSDNRLFVTLDSTARRVRTADGKYFILSDTVGFIRRLPHELVEGFRATLADTADSDLLIIVLDVSCPEWRAHLQQIEDILTAARAGGERLIVMNKIDRLPAAQQSVSGSCDKIAPIYLSCRTGEGLKIVQKAIAEHTVSYLAAVD